MPQKTDSLLLESVSTHRRRMQQAFLYGDIDRRRVVNNNVKRVIGSVVLAAVVGVGCLGYSFVVDLMLAKDSSSTSSVPAPPRTTEVP